MEQSDNTLTCVEILARADKLGYSDAAICNKAKALKMKLSRTTLWRIRNGKLKGRPYLSTLLKLVKVLGHE